MLMLNQHRHQALTVAHRSVGMKMVSPVLLNGLSALKHLKGRVGGSHRVSIARDDVLSGGEGCPDVRIVARIVHK